MFPSFISLLVIKKSGSRQRMDISSIFRWMSCKKSTIPMRSCTKFRVLLWMKLSHNDPLCFFGACLIMKVLYHKALMERRTPMASIEKRISKSGERTYHITVCAGYGFAAGRPINRMPIGLISRQTRQRRKKLSALNSSWSRDMLWRIISGFRSTQSMYWN